MVIVVQWTLYDRKTTSGSGCIVVSNVNILQAAENGRMLNIRLDDILLGT